MIGDDDKVILYEKSGFLNRYKTTALTDGTNGPIKLIKWRGRFAAWWSKKGVIVYDIVQMKTISIVKFAPVLHESDVQRDKMTCRWVVETDPKKRKKKKKKKFYGEMKSLWRLYWKLKEYKIGKYKTENTLWLYEQSPFPENGRLEKKFPKL